MEQPTAAEALKKLEPLLGEWVLEATSPAVSGCVPALRAAGLDQHRRLLRAIGAGGSRSQEPCLGRALGRDGFWRRLWK